MAVNLLDLFSRSVTPDAVQGISKLLGEDPSAVKGGVAALVPVLLGAFASKASTPSGAASLFSMINSSDVDTGVMQSKFPLEYADRVYTLRQHLDYVRTLLERQAERSRGGAALATTGIDGRSA